MDDTIRTTRTAPRCIHRLSCRHSSRQWTPRPLPTARYPPASSAADGSAAHGAPGQSADARRPFNWAQFASVDARGPRLGPLRDSGLKGRRRVDRVAFGPDLPDAGHPVVRVDALAWYVPVAGRPLFRPPARPATPAGGPSPRPRRQPPALGPTGVAGRLPPVPASALAQPAARRLRRWRPRRRPQGPMVCPWPVT